MKQKNIYPSTTLIPFSCFKNYIPEDLISEVFGELYIDYFEISAQIDPVAIWEMLNRKRDFWEETGSENMFLRLNKSFLQISEIKKKYKLIETTFDNFVISNNDFLLDWPFLDLSVITYEDLLIKIFKNQNISSYKKRIGKAIERYGTRVINNLLILSEMYDLSRDLDKILSLNHEKRIWSVFFYKKEETKDIILLKEIFTPERIFKMMTNQDNFHHSDYLRKQFAAIRFLKICNVDFSFLSTCESFDEMHEKIFRNEKFAKLTNIQIDQEILDWDLDGRILSSGHRVNIPKSSYEIVCAANEMENCLYYFSDWSVIGSGGDRYIIFLEKGTKTEYAVEIRGKEITAIKGRDNSDPRNNSIKEELKFYIEDIYSRIQLIL